MLVGHEPFAVILGDDVIDAHPPALRQMIDVFEEVDGPVLAIEEVPSETSAPTGSSTRRKCARASTRSATWSRKPPRDEAPSNLAIIGRYILTPDIFPALEETAKDRTGEIQLTNGLRRLLKKRPIYGCRIDGVRHDTGNKLGFLKAVVYFALRRPDLADPFREYLQTLDLDEPAVEPLSLGLLVGLVRTDFSDLSALVGGRGRRVARGARARRMSRARRGRRPRLARSRSRTFARSR